MSKKFLLDSVFKSFTAKFKKNEDTIRAGLKYVEALPQLGESAGYRDGNIILPEEATEVIIMYPGKAVDKYKEILNVWSEYTHADQKPFEHFVSVLDTVVTDWEDGKTVQGPTFDIMRSDLKKIQALYMRYWMQLDRVEREYFQILTEDECVDRAFLKLYGPAKQVSYDSVIHKIIGKYRLIQKYPEMNLKRDEHISDRLQSLCITLARSMDYVSTEEDDSGFDRYRYEANQILYYLNWYNEMLEHDIRFNINVIKLISLKVPVKVYPRYGKWNT